MNNEAKPIFFISPTKSTPEIKRSIDEYLANWLAIHSSSKPKLLFHYTSLEGLKGILQNRSIWFSHINTLNDPLELQYGKKLILDVINGFYKEEEDGRIKLIFKNLIDLIKGFGEVMYHGYVACFCEEENLLSQWRSYAAMGGGYNLGILFNSGTKFVLNQDDLSKDSFIILRKVIYDPEQQKNIVNDYIAKIISGARQAMIRWNDQEEEIPPAWEPQVAIESVNLLFDIMFCFKNEVFKEEKEWRLIKANPLNENSELLNFRVRNENLIPYFNFFIFDNSKEAPVFPVKKIKFGPSLEAIITKKSLELFLESMSKKSHQINLDYKSVQISGAGFSIR